MAHPNFNVNLKNEDGETPLSVGCVWGKVSVVQLLLKDRRVNVTLDDNWQRTPLWSASNRGHLEGIEWLIASGRDLGDIERKVGWWYGKFYTDLEIAREKERTGI